jgi:transposase
MEAGSSVARVAMKHGVNANQVFKWRRLYEAGRLGSRAARLRFRQARGCGSQLA